MIGGNGMTLNSETAEEFTFKPEDFTFFGTCESCLRKKMVGFHYVDIYLFFICASCK